MKSFFAFFTRLSLQFRIVTLAISLVIAVLGLIAVTQLQLELIPGIEFPQSIVLAQVSGMSSDEVLEIITEPLEAEIANIEEIVNTETTTTGAFGSVIVASNEFGLNQEEVRQQVQAGIDNIWLPVRRIEAPDGEGAEAFASRLLGEMTPDVLIYLHGKNSSFLFQLSPEVWNALPLETVETVLAYLASQTQASAAAQSPLHRTVELEIVPQLEALELVADVSISGGQALPGENSGLAADSGTDQTQSESLLLQLPREVWAVVSERVDGIDAKDESAVEALSAIDFEIPEEVPALPESWQMDRFVDASDLLEISTLTRPLPRVFNNFEEAGSIVGPLGQTNDLTADIVSQMLALAPSMVEHFEPEHLAAMSDEVFAMLPEEYVAGLDGFARDELAAASIAVSITGQDVEREPEDLPDAWQISLPQIITFSFDDLPLATFSISSNGAIIENNSPESNPTTDTDTGDDAEVVENTNNPSSPTGDIPEGPAMPQFFALLGEQFGFEMDTADDLINIQLPEDFAAVAGSDTLQAADFFNFLTLLSDPAALSGGGGEDAPGGFDAESFDIAAFIPALTECGINPLSLAGGDFNLAEGLVGCVSADAIAFIAEQDPAFVDSLQPEIFAFFSDEVLALPQIAPPLPSEWDTLAAQPQFAGMSLQNTADLIALGDGHAADILNRINETVPEQFAGYEVRLFDSLNPTILRYITLQESDFYSHLDSEVLGKFSAATLTTLPEDTLTPELESIASGDTPSALDELSSLYASDVPPADPNAPAINEDWLLLGNFYGIEMDTADDFFRFPDGFIFENITQMMNGIFESPQGASFAPQLFGGLSVEAVEYMQERDPAVFDDLRIEALQELPEEVLAALPEAVQEQAISGDEPFEPTTTVTRSNGEPSLQLTVFKVGGVNTVTAFHAVEDLLEEIDAENEMIGLNVVFEQASFIEESIDGVAREGGLGGVFAVLMILLFLSSGVWARSPRRTAGVVMIVLSAVLLGLLVSPNLEMAGGDVMQAFNMVNIVISVPALLVLVAGIIFVIYPGNLPYPAWRSTLVTAVSIPLSILMAFALMRWMSPAVHDLLLPAADSPLIAFILRLFPEDITLNIMTLSGLTVAVGRIVDDSIVVLENIFRELGNDGVDKRTAIIQGAKDVSVAIFAATLITVVVFIPLGLTGGIIGEFFLPFGLAVTYSLMSSFVVAITVVPVLTYLFVRTEDVQHGEEHGVMERLYLPSLKWALSSNRHRLAVIAIAFATMAFSGILFGTRPVAFLPDFGEPEISITVDLPGGTKVLDTNALVSEIEAFVDTNPPENGISAIETIIGSGGISMESFLGIDGGISENMAQITIAIESQDELDSYTDTIRTAAEEIFGEENVVVSAASVASGGFGGFDLILSGQQADLEAINETVIQTLNEIEGLTNVTSTLSQVGGGGDTGPVTYLRVNGETAISYSGELESEDSLTVIQDAKAAVQALPDLPESVIVSEGFETEIQTQGFQSLFIAMGIAIAIVVIILIVTFGSLVHWLDIILSIMVAPVGAAVALTLTDRALGISSMIGLLMLIGIVVTNAVVLIDRVMANIRERHMPVEEALIEAGGRRLRPILMTAFATIFALLPLAVGLSEGAIIASELGTVVIGGLVSSTLLTLIVVPAAFSLLHPLHRAIMGIFGRNNTPDPRKNVK